MKKTVAVLILLAGPALALAQTQSAGNSAEMRKLDFLLGAWEGEGWMEVGPGQRRAVKVKESVQTRGREIGAAGTADSHRRYGLSQMILAGPRRP